MPSVSSKVEIMASPEATEPIKKVLTIIDKKVRNLEKRKLKLDSYRQKQECGEDLEKDQKVAVDKYGEVVTNLEFAKDLQKQFHSINKDVDKLMKKQAKRGKSEKQLQEMKKIKELFQLQGLLKNLKSTTVRSDFQTGKHGAIVLTEENLEQLDKFYKLITPMHDNNTDYLESLSEASEHIVSLLDAKEKPVIGSTYKDLKELLDLIAGCGYFEKVKTEGFQKEEVVGAGNFEVVKSPCLESDAVQPVLPQKLPDNPPEQLVRAGHQHLAENACTIQSQGIAAQVDSLFTTQVSSQVQQQQQHAVLPAFSQHSRPLQGIETNVQGNFNFLQESTIDLDVKSEFLPRMDHAVVAAHSMLKSTQTHIQVPSSQKTERSSHQHVFGASSYHEEPLTFGDHQSGDPTVRHPHGAVLDQMNYTPANASQSQDFASSGFGQSSLTHSLKADNLFSGVVSSCDASPENMVVMIGKGASDASAISHGHFDIPPQLPMPLGHDQTGVQAGHQTESEKKGYPMNPNATEFQSLIFAQPASENTDISKSDDGIQGEAYSDYILVRRSGHNRAGFQGARGSNSGARGGNMSNGYSNGRRGRGKYQNYPRNEYHQTDGYQHYRGNRGGKFYNNNDEFQSSDSNRSEGMSRGGNRGAPRGGFNKSGSGPQSGTARGSNSHGFRRPNLNKPSQ